MECAIACRCLYSRKRQFIQFEIYAFVDSFNGFWFRLCPPIFLTSCFWVKWCQCRAPSSIHIHRRDTHTQRVDTSCLCNCNSPSCGGGDGGASQFAKSLFVLFGALSFISRRSRRRNKYLTVSFNSRTYQSVVISVWCVVVTLIGKVTASLWWMPAGCVYAVSSQFAVDGVHQHSKQKWVKRKNAKSFTQIY